MTASFRPSNDRRDPHPVDLDLGPLDICAALERRQRPGMGMLLTASDLQALKNLALRAVLRERLGDQATLAAKTSR